LQSTKKNYLAQTDDILQSHPYYWAPFVQYGATAPLEFKTGGWNSYLMIGLGLLLATMLLFYLRSRQR